MWVREVPWLAKWKPGGGLLAGVLDSSVGINATEMESVPSFLVLASS